MMAIQIYRHYIEPKYTDLVLWRPYAGFWIYPPEKRNGLDYPLKLGMTIGRNIQPNIDKEQLESLPKKMRDQIIERFKGETGFRPNITLRDSIANLIISATHRIDKILGIKVEYVSPKDIEIFEYLKSEDWRDFIPVIRGLAYLIGHGVGFEHQKIDAAKKLLKLEIEKWVEKGYDRARKEGW